MPTQMTADFQRDYGKALRNLHLNESEIERQASRLTTTEGLDADALARRNFDAIILERNLRVQAKVRKTVRRFIGFSRLMIPISAFIALGIWYAIM